MKRWALVLLLASTPVGAHELGPLQVRVGFEPDGTHAVEVVLDEEHLPAVEAVPFALPEGLRPRTAAFASAYLQGVELVFDGQAERPGTITAAPGDKPGFVTLRWTARTPPGARAFAWRESLPLTFHPIGVRVADGEPSQQWIQGPASTDAVALDARVVPTRAQVFGAYLALGFEHILPRGLDHILFVLGLFLLSRRLRPILVQVTSFTLAHTLTLALSMRGLVSLSSRVVEPLIAASIVYVAVENLMTRELSPWRPALVFAFGLLHGMGFAGVLRDIGLPAPSFLPALVGFNLGVEAGQLTVLLGAFVLTILAARRPDSYRRRVVVPGSVAIGAAGLFWLVQRTLGA